MKLCEDVEKIKKICNNNIYDFEKLNVIKYCHKIIFTFRKLHINMRKLDTIIQNLIMKIKILLFNSPSLKTSHI